MSTKTKTGRGVDRVSRKRRTDAVAVTQSCPCEYCPHYSRCASKELACTDFLSWVTDPHKAGNKFASLRHPDAPTFDKVFSREEEPHDRQA